MEDTNEPNYSLDLASAPKHNVRLTNEEWFEISLALEPHHAVFHKIWQMGRPVFDDTHDTAWVTFDSKGEFASFHFNPLMWQRLELKDKIFVFCHEALHIILNHGVRTLDAGRRNNRAVNAALDVVVNHALVNNFGFDRKNIEDWDDYHWVDTTFKHKKPLPPSDESFEYYYNLFEKIYGDGGPGDGTPGSGPREVDEHSEMGSGGKMIDNLNEALTEEEKESLKSIIDKHFQKPPKEAKNQPAGSGTGGQWVFANSKVIVKRKWETVIKKWSKKYLIPKEKDVEQWARLNRRLVMLPRNMFLPSDMEYDDHDREKKLIPVWFFLDTSGSCWGLKDRFFAAAQSLPTDRFDMRLFCFDTTVQETTLESRKIYGGGGTSFSILEQKIKKEMSESGMAYPEAVFVITDGEGNNIKPEHPERWHWFLTAGGTKRYIDKDCKFFNLEDYE